MRKLVALAVVAAGLLGGDVAARAWAEAKLAEQAAAYYPPSSGATASIRSFPFLGRLFVLGEVPEVSLSLAGMQAEGLLVPVVSFDLETVEVDRSELLGGRVHVLDVGRGRVLARIDGASLARATGADVRFADGVIEIHRRIRGVDVSATARASVEGNLVRLTAVSVQGLPVPVEELTLEYRIPGVELVPCRADVRAEAAGLVVECVMDDVPATFVQAFGGS